MEYTLRYDKKKKVGEEKKHVAKINAAQAIKGSSVTAEAKKARERGEERKGKGKQKKRKKRKKRKSYSPPALLL